MDYLWRIHYDYTWGGLLWLALLLTGIYLSLQLAFRLLNRQSAPKNWQRFTLRYVEYCLLVFEPLALLILSSYFVIMKPFYHGLMILLVVLIGFRHLRNYFSGCVLRFDGNLTPGTRLTGRTQQGLITQLGRFGLNLQTEQGLHYLNYDQIVSQGYTLSTATNDARFVRLLVAAEETAQADKATLHDLLASIPYLNWNFDTQITDDPSQAKSWQIEVALHDASHLEDLCRRLDEQDFIVTVNKI